MPAELDHILQQLLQQQYLQADRWHDRSTPAAVTLTEQGRQLARELSADR